MIGHGSHNNSWGAKPRSSVGTGAALNAKHRANRILETTSSAPYNHEQPNAFASMTADTMRPARILIVARPATSRAISTTLALAGYEVHRTPDGNSAVEAARRLRPNLAIVTADVPGSSGQLVACRLRSSQDELPIIVLGVPQEESDGRALLYLPEDIAPSLLLASIADQIVKHPNSGDMNGR